MAYGDDDIDLGQGRFLIEPLALAEDVVARVAVRVVAAVVTDVFVCCECGFCYCGECFK